MLPAPPLVQSVLNSLTMDCEHKEQGCASLVPMEHFPSHLNNCDYRVSWPNGLEILPEQFSVIWGMS
jgi:hypothetical protein